MLVDINMRASINRKAACKQQDLTCMTLLRRTGLRPRHGKDVRSASEANIPDVRVERSRSTDAAQASKSSPLDATEAFKTLELPRLESKWFGRMRYEPMRLKQT